MKLSRAHWFILIAMLYVTYTCMMWKWGHQGDMEFWMNWARAIHSHGFANIYENGSNYLPAYLYFLLLHVKIQGNLTDIQDNLYTIKYYTFIFDVLGALLILRLVKDELKKLFFFLLMMFNIAYIYNTVFWGQVDAIYTFFGFASLLMAIEKRVLPSVLLLFIALNFKLQAMVFIPVTGLLLLPQIISKEGFRKLCIAAGIAVVLQILILLPFIMAGKLGNVWEVITGSFGHYPYPTVGAFNVWTLLLPHSITDMYTINDSEPFHWLSYRQTGYLMFFTALFAALFPLVKYLYRRLRNNIAESFPLQKLFLISALVSVCFYFFNTEMHERYAHPMILLLSAYAFTGGVFLPLVLGSVAYFLNLERINWYLHLHRETYEKSLAFDPKFVAILYLLLIIALFYLLYRKEKTPAAESGNRAAEAV